MKNLFLIFTIIILGLGAQAQVNMDSLWGVWNDEKQCDTCRLKAIGKIIWDGYMLQKPDSALILTQFYFEFAKNTKEKLYVGRALNTYGAIESLKGNFAKAIDYYNKCLVIYKEFDHKKGIAVVYGNIGDIYAQKGQYTKALEYNNKSIKLFEEIDNKMGVANRMNGLGLIYMRMENYSKALEYFNHFLEYNEKINDKFRTASAYGNIGAVYASLGDNYKALSYVAKAIDVFYEINYKQGIGTGLAKMGSLYKNQGDYTKALDYYMQGLKIYEELNNKYRIGEISRSIGILNLMLNDEDKAIEWCEKALKSSTDIGDIGNQRVACDCLYKAYKSQGKGNKALEYHERMNILDDSLKKEETSKKLQQMEFAKQLLADSLLQVEEKLKVEHAHELEIQKKKRSRNIYIAIGIFILFLAIVLWSRLRYTRRAKGTIEKEKGRSDDLLLNILPAEIAEELKAKGEAKAAKFELVSILFTDFKGFTEVSEKFSAHDLVAEINSCFKEFDRIIEKHKVEKIKTIGDAYMAAGGLPVPTQNSVLNTVKAALEMQAFITKRKALRNAFEEPAFEMRVGIHSGPVVAGIVGMKKFQYDIWGDSVNIASRIESNGEVGKVNISQTTYEFIKDEPGFVFEHRGKIEAKGKGEIEMWFVDYIEKDSN